MAAPPSPLWRILAEGAVTAVGTGAWQCAASWIGGVRRLRRAPHPALGGAMLTTAPCPEVTRSTTGTARLARLLGMALADLCAQVHGQVHAQAEQPMQPAGVVLALPSGTSPAEAAALWQQALLVLDDYAPTRALAQLPCVAVADGGATAGLHALARLGAAAPHCGPVLLAGVDSLLGTADLAQAHAAGRLYSADHPHSTSPGEAAGCLLLEPLPALPVMPQTERALRRDEAGQPAPDALAPVMAPRPCDVLLHRPGLALAPAEHQGNPHQPPPEALAQAIEQALGQAGWAPSHIERLMSDADGSPWRAQLLGQAIARAARGCTAAPWEAAPFTGQIGAATAPVYWAMAAQRLRRSAHAPARILCCLSDPGRHAGAVAVQRVAPLAGA